MHSHGDGGGLSAALPSWPLAAESGHAGSANPLLRASQPLFECLLLIRLQAGRTDLASLQAQLISLLAVFGEQAGRSGVPPGEVAMARYCLCTLLDETIGSTPWGGPGWAQRSLLQTFYQEAVGGERFFTILQCLAQAPEQNLTMLEFLFVLFALGLQGRYRLIDRGPVLLQHLRERLYLLLRAKRMACEISLWCQDYHSRSSPRRASRRWRKWHLAVLLGGCVSLASGVFLLDGRLGLAAAGVLQVLTRLPPPRQRPAPAPHFAAMVNLLRQRLASEMGRGQLRITSESDVIRITLPADRLFAVGSTALLPGHHALLLKIAQLLASVPGLILVQGHTDNQPATPGVVDNWQLSRGRAAAVASVLLFGSGQPDRYRVEGLAGSMPREPDDSSAQRAENRRIEISLLEPEGRRSGV